MNLNHLSYSSINSYLTCPRSWKFKYVDQVPSKTTSSLAFGSAVHTAIEAVIRTRTLGAPVDILTEWSAAWNRQLEREPFVPDDGDTPESLHNDGVRLLTNERVSEAILGLRATIWNGEPVIEHRVELRVPGVPIPVIGYIDAIDENGTPMDFKTSSKSWSGDKASLEVQPLFYLAALNQAGIHHQYRFRHVILVKTKTPAVQVFGTQFLPGQLFWLMQMIVHVWRAIDGGHFPTNPTSWRCTPTWCEYWALCRGRQ